MPELPEVETIVQDLKPFLEGQRIAKVEILKPKLVVDLSPEALEGKTIHQVKRRGKFVVLELSDGSGLLFHLRLTGRLYLAPASDASAVLTVHTEEGVSLSFYDPRGLGRAYWHPEPEEFLRFLGPEPLDEGFTPQNLQEILAGKKASVKAVLLDQRNLAGLGNIYTDEALFLAGIHPRRPAFSLSREEVEKLHQAIREVLKGGIERRGTTFSTYRDAFGRKGENQLSLNVFRRTGKPCPHCGTPIERMKVAGRSSHFCPKCQPL
ncbi:MAG: bifunctional DNA-formamidopyrimidine glycosylase/DNA-(apurinic or apyrimidinic site) lyase [Anaerolineae bacterium]|nr:bifunctional DNA-formamidopyrimidine glycosylase/DNA-(apurinic or apyrimidinic site) lyase [Anaerolineae bacterium]MDW8102004.1 bifunctional DNA-formamidopyrimidine glycosylase/DNA-(apurinic or apyrimidinic site) lyase [Anaerolineae bacterium]